MQTSVRAMGKTSRAVRLSLRDSFTASFRKTKCLTRFHSNLTENAVFHIKYRNKQYLDMIDINEFQQCGILTSVD